MLRHRVIPVLLIKNGGLVKTTQFKSPVYLGDPINAVKIFNEKEVDELILLDITATNERKNPNYAKIKDIASEAFMPVGYGGGITNIEQIGKLFNLGIEKIILNTTAHINSSLIKVASKIFGNQSIVVAVDVKRNLLGRMNIYTHGGKVKQKTNFVRFLKKVEEFGAGEVLINSIDNDGMMKGYDLDIIKTTCENLNIPVISCGGAGTLHDIANAVKAGASAVSAGSMFVFHGVHKAVLISYPKYAELEEILKID